MGLLERMEKSHAKPVPQEQQPVEPHVQPAATQQSAPQPQKAPDIVPQSTSKMREAERNIFANANIGTNNSSLREALREKEAMRARESAAAAEAAASVSRLRKPQNQELTPESLGGLSEELRKVQEETHREVAAILGKQDTDVEINIEQLLEESRKIRNKGQVCVQTCEK